MSSDIPGVSLHNLNTSGGKRYAAVKEVLLQVKCESQRV